MDALSYHITVIPFGEIHKPQQRQFLLAILSIREQVFVEEQHVPLAIDQDGKDAESAHLIIWEQDTPIGTLRFRKTEEGIKLERIAVLPEYRGRHIGRLLVREGIRAIRMAGGEGTIYLHAQCDAARFYTRMGFVETGKQFVEAGIAHISMILPAEAENSLLCDGGELPEG